MNKRSKSTINITRKKQLLAQEKQLLQLQQKIKQSKPILKDIYNKVKKKQEILLNEVIKSKEKLSHNKQLMKQYMKLYQQGLLIIEKNQFSTFQQSSTNYQRRYPNQETIKKNKNKSLYEMYKDKLTKRININPQFKQIQQKAKQISSAMENQIEVIKLARERSKNNISSKTNFRKLDNQRKQRQQQYQQKESSQEKQYHKAKFIEIQKKKFHNQKYKKMINK